MALSHELVSQFAKLVNKDKKTGAEATVYGTVVVDGENKYVKVDGSDQLIPIEDGSTVVDANADERVSVSIKDHTATVTGNVSSPAARTGDVKDVTDRVTEIEKFDLVLAERVEAQEGYIEDLQADMAEIGDLKAATAKIEQLEANDVEITGKLESSEAEIETLKTTKLDVEVANAQFATIDKLNANTAKINQLDADKASVHDLEAVEADVIKLNAEKASVTDLNATNAKIENLDSTFATIEKLDAATAKIEDLEAEDAKITGTLDAHKAVIEDLNSSYATIDFANIKMAAVEELFAKSGIIKDLVVGNTSITGELVGVTLKGDLIEAGTLKADKLVVKGSDGIFYKLNVEAGGISAEEAPDDGLHGSVIVAKSITAEKVNVHDLVAFGATIGGFKITSEAIHSVAKASVDNTTEGIYMDSTGQFNVGNGSNFLKFFKDQNGVWKLNVSADTITFGTDKKSVEEAIDEVAESTKSNTEDLTKYIAETTKELENLQGQIDGSITTWFFEYEPTNDNVPASEWNSTALKNNHLGDLFYDTLTGYCYRWQVQNNNYKWDRITDVDVTKALSDAAKAQSTADGKRRVFVDTPKPPYDIGDLWAQGVSGELMRCQTAKTEAQSYAAADWVKASKYTDDTAANAAQADANALKTRVTSAETKIDQNTEAINLRATKKEVTETLGGYYTKTEADAKLAVSTESVKTEVSKTYATKQEVDDIQIGGRNLLLNSSFKESINEWQTVGDVLDEQNTISGYGVVRADDVSDKAPATVQLSSKNLLNLTDLYGKTVTSNGGTLSCGADGGITGSGTPTGYITICSKRVDLPKGIYTLSVSGTFSGITCDLSMRDVDGNLITTINAHAGRLTHTFDLNNYPNYSYFVLEIKRGSNNVEMSGTVYCQLERGSTATPYTPYIGSKNLLDLSQMTTEDLVSETGNNGYALFADNGDGTYTFTKIGNYGYITAPAPLNIKAGTQVMLSVNLIETYSQNALLMRFNHADGDWNAYNFSYNGSPSQFTPKKDVVSVQIYVSQGSAAGSKVIFEKAQIEIGTIATPYTPHSPTGALCGYTVDVHGKNLLDYADCSFSSCTYDPTTEAITSNISNYYFCTIINANKLLNYCRNNMGQTLTFSTKTCPNNSRLSVVIYGTRDDGSKYYETPWVPDGQNYCSFTIPTDFIDMTKVELRFNRKSTAFSDSTTQFTEFQVEVGDTATAYEPYCGAIHTADINGAVAIDTPYSSYMTAVVNIDGINLDMTYRLIGNEFSEKYGKPCLWLKYYTLDKEKSLYQSVAGKLEPDIQYTLSGWLLSENVTEGSSNFGLTFHHQGVTTDGAAFSYGSIPFEVNATVGSWKYVSVTFTTDSNSANPTSEDIYIHTQDLIGDVYFCDLKLEKGNRATDWTPAPEDTDSDIEDVKISVLAETRASLEVTEKSVLSKVEESYVNTGSFDEYKSFASSQVKQTANDLTVSFKDATDGLESKLDGEIAKREKHFKMSEDGLIISAGENKVSVIVNNDLIAFIKGPEQRMSILVDGITIYADGTDFKQGSGIYILSDTIDYTDFGGFVLMAFDDGSYCILNGVENFADIGAKPGAAYIYDENGPSLERLGEQLLGYWDGNNFYGGNLMIRVDERAQFGNFAAIPRSNGNLSWLKVK